MLDGREMMKWKVLIPQARTAEGHNQTGKDKDRDDQLDDTVRV